VGQEIRVKTFVDAIKFIGDNTDLLWHKVVEHLALSGAAVGVAILIAIPLGVWLGHIHRGNFLAITISNVGRALPSLAVIAINIALVGLGFRNVLIALVVLAVPIMLTNAYIAVDGVDRDAVEAAKGMGMRGRDVLWRIELPLALPLIFAGVRTATVYVIATATLAAIAGGGGLGDIIVSQATYKIAGVVGAALLVTALAFAAEALFALLQRAVTPRGLRAQREHEQAAPLVGPAVEATT
jgi:osmoprotectant transport system permease protein